MERFGWMATGKRAVLLAGIASLVLVASGSAMAHEGQAPAADPLKFSTSQSVILGWQVKAANAKDWEDFWAGMRALCAKSESAELKAFGESLSKIVKVDQAFDMAGTPTTLYLFMLETPSTVFTYNPVPVLYTDPAGFKAGTEGSKVTRPEADALYEKFKAAFHSVGVIWKINKVG
jgi:hypothetical protein